MQKLSRRARRFISSVLHFAERRERALNSLLGITAIAMAAVSLYVSTKANQAADRANQINEEAMNLSLDAADSKKAITLKGTISGDPPILTLTPVSSDFVLSDSSVYYPCGGDRCPQFSRDRGTPGVHDLSIAVASIEEVIKQRDRQRYVFPDGSISEQWLPEWYPILIRLDYVYEGQPLEAHHLYIVIYKDPTSEVFNAAERSPEPVDQSVKLERVHFLEGVPQKEALEHLDKQYRFWRRVVDQGPAYP